MRQELIDVLLSDLTEGERKFLLSLKLGEPDWSLIPIPGLQELPSLQWKVLNIQKMNKAKREIMFGKLEKVLGF